MFLMQSFNLKFFVFAKIHSYKTNRFLIYFLDNKKQVYVKAVFQQYNKSYKQKNDLLLSHINIKIKLDQMVYILLFFCYNVKAMKICLSPMSTMHSVIVEIKIKLL